MESLLDYLRQEERRGVTHVRLDEEARAVLRHLYRSGQPGARPVRRQPGAAPAASTPVAEGSSREEQLESLRAQAEQWGPARTLGTLRETMVFAVGNPEAELVLVGEAPGFEEERKREPFVGRAGQKLDQILKAMGLQRDDVYISNICKFRPAMKGQTTNNRRPTREEMDACLPFVEAELGIVQPKCIVALGGTAAQGLLGCTEGVGLLREKWRDYRGIPLRVTYHPSYLLHNDTALAEKRKVWQDMLAVMEKLGLPISEKQRGFFGNR